MSEVTQEYLKEHFDYNPRTGAFWRIKKVRGSKLKLNFTQWSKRRGYFSITIQRVTYVVHRLIWMWVHGVWPDEIDHINGDKTDNKISNLRSVTHRENHINKQRPSNNSSGVIGVYWDNEKKRWRSSIWIYGKRSYLGSFAEKVGAITARKDAERSLNYHSNHGRAVL